MNLVSRSDVERALERAGLQQGDAVLVHSNLMRFGRPEGGMNTYLDAFDRVLGPHGTIAVPTFSFSFIQTGYYHWQDTSSEGMGAFAETIRRRPDAMRARHPLQSVAVVGSLAKDVAAIEAPSAYSPDGIFNGLCARGFKILVFGAEPIHISHSHLSEERAEVPYRFHKPVTGTACLGPNEADHSQTWSFFARDLDLDVRPEGEDAIVLSLIESGDWVRDELNDVPIYAGAASTFVDLLSDKLAADPLWMVPDRNTVTQQLELMGKSLGT
ncbi:MAG: AAC(3) family N-acetyltransferase [Tateyamaria sp.]|uniref:AAC(3) family N-acetyltransferase n=1 Tax=Tateyamaria sp. TaxID=1929288 RepID=UPI00327C66EA